MNKKLSLKKAYYRIFLGMIVVPLFLVLVISLFILGDQYKDKAIENIESVQKTVAAELISDIDFMSMRLSQIINVNNNMMIQYATQIDAGDMEQRYRYQELLDQSGNMIIEPVKDVISVAFYMKSGNEIFLKSHIKRSIEEIQQCQWYQDAVNDVNSVKIGSYQTTAASDFYTGGGKDCLVLIYAIAPNLMADRSRTVELIALYQTTNAGTAIKNYNRNYQRGTNKLGVMRIVDENGAIVYSTEQEESWNKKGYTTVRTKVDLENTDWYIETSIKTTELMQDFTRIAVMLLLVAALLFSLVGYFAGYFIKKIVNPIEELSAGLKQIEDGNMDIHIVPQGQAEIRGVIHHFNAMARSLNSMIKNYEERVRRAEKTPSDYLAGMIKGEIPPQQVETDYPEFFADSYALIQLHFQSFGGENLDFNTVKEIFKGFDRNPRYTLRCVGYLESVHTGFLFYRAGEENYQERLEGILKELQNSVKTESNVEMQCCIGTKGTGASEFADCLAELRTYGELRYLYGENAVVDLTLEKEEKEQLIQKKETYKKLADALYSADDKNFLVEKEHLYERLNTSERTEAEQTLYGVILAIASRFESEGVRFSELFNQEYNYKEKIGRLDDVRSMKMWITNYVNWVMEYAASKIDVVETNVIVKAKRYLMDHYDNPELTLLEVAQSVGLSEKYFTNRFSKETGETFSSYLTQLRIQKAKELLRTTTFKSYEISEMVGYRNAEHFTRVFKKETGCTPAQYRKQEM